ncbi:choice-of-anchor J domain-containing protein [Wenzhouxiangella marina]|uniref:Uncharacterized protein n=1 Tax=Wenzhouxiangella marina TaxID=1579979 RepID=A0A0K0Y0D5_9GAMM|nr:choice-of-anchor J domain-containing protein [Wenzhouxiangella marina]AKS43326.1 hypothetical protein WM2015_2973 [Wenzhouxiangella marina]MBB6088559.1 hypothetical protein [Wenzhouxiangella marina]
MSSSSSPWAAGRHLVALGLILLAGGLMANTPVSQTIDPSSVNAVYSPADAQGRFTYLIQFSEPSLIEQHHSRSQAEFDYFAPANLAARDQLMAIQAQRVSLMSQTLGRTLEPSHFYLTSRNGIAVRLTPAEAERVASMNGVEALHRERLYDIATFRGPEFIGAGTIWDGTNTPDGSPLLGELMIAAVLDSGISDPATHPSFINDPACGHGVGGVPDKVISFLDCSSADGTGLCNGPDGLDENGHGSHTASTVAGNFVTNAATPSPELPAPFTAISGVAPCAHIRSYDVCSANGGQSCGGADIAAGLESVLIQNSAPEGPIASMNYSISGGASPWADFDRTKLDIVDAGVFIAASAGNTSAGVPDPVGAVNHRGPWVMSVAASTHDGRIGKSVSLAGGPSGVFAIEGSGPAMTVDFVGDLRWAGDVDAGNVEGCAAFAAGSFAGEAALISRGGCAFADKVNNAVAAGAVFVIVYNNAGDPIVMGGLETTTVPSVMISTDDGNAMIATLAGGVAEVTVPVADAGFVVPSAGDILAGFSLRGPTASPLQDLQKPNITGPGVNILAAVPGGYAFLSGTSMSSPHVAGAAILVRQANPDWTPSEVKSAMQMTAFRDGFKEDGVTPWDADDVGHGRVDLTAAALAGLVMDESTANYLAADPNLGGDVKTLNTPDVRNLDCTPSCSFTRTLRNTLDVASSWTVSVESGNPDLDIQVTPSSFSFTGDTNEEVTLTIDVSPLTDLTSAIQFGRILIDEDTAQAPQAHLTTAISGTPSAPAAAAIDETEFTILLEENTTGSASFNISNVGEGVAVEDLTYTIEEAAPATVVLGGSREASPPQPVDLVLDTGIATIVGVDTQEILWFNQFTPGPLDLPFTLETVDVAFAPGNAGVNPGDVFDVHVWVDPDRDPTNGATLVSSVVGEVVTAGVNFQTVTLPAGVDITTADGDVLIGVVNRTTAALYRAGVADAPGTANGESWIAFNFPGGVAGDPPVFANAATFAPLGALLPDRNWTIRGFGTGGSACLTPADVPWLSVTPASGSVAAGASEEVTINVDSTGLATGTYEARVCVETSDVNNPVFVLPVTLEVTVAGGLPTIDVSATSVDGAVDVLNPTTTETFDIGNLGTDLVLEWSIEEAQTLASMRGNPTLSVNGVEVFEGLGTPTNSSVTLNIGAGNSVIGVGYEVTIEAFSPSWLSESRMAILSNAGDPLGLGAEIQPSDTDGSGVETLSSGGVVALGSPVAANGAGEIYIEWFEDFNDTTPAPDSAWSDSATPTTLPPGITLQCTNQAACDAALGGGPPPSVCESPSDVPWVSVSPTSGTTAALGTSSVNVDFDATGLAPGLYEATLCINSNDPVTPRVELPVSLDVTVPANAALLEGTVQGLGRCQASPILAAGAGVEVVGAFTTFNLTADANGFYSLYLDEAEGPLDITASAPNHITDTVTGVAIAGSTTTVQDFGLVLEAPCAQVAPAGFDAVFGPGDTAADFAMTIDNSLGGAQLVWGIQEADPAAIAYAYGLDGAGELINNTGGDRASESIATERLGEQSPFVDAGIQGGPITDNFSEAFDDISLLAGAGWSLQNLSAPLGTSDWFQGNDTVFAAHEGATTAYIGANFNNTAGGTGIISNWLMTPEIQLTNGTEMTFWTRVPTGSTFPDRLEVRLSTSGSSTFAGASATDVGDFDTLLLSINENLGGDYPDDWAQFTVSVDGLPGQTSGRFAFRYFVTDAGPSGANSNYIGIDTVSISQPNFCTNPADVPWLSVAPFFGAVDAGGTSPVTVSVDASGLMAGTYEAFVCVSSNDAGAGIIPVPFSLEILGDDIFQDRFEF